MSYLEIERALEKPYITDEELCAICKSTRALADMAVQCTECHTPLADDMASGEGEDNE